MELDDSDWARLAELRAGFLGAEDGEDALDDYWSSARDLALYDATFAQRIGWKWRAALGELARRDPSVRAPLVAPALLDWGCGTGIAARTWVATLGATSLARVDLWDRSGPARRFAAERLRAEAPGLEVRELDAPPPAHDGVLIASHVLGELDDPGEAALVALARTAALLVWLEPGSRATSRRLSALRDALLATHVPVAPCPHAGPCSALRDATGRQWCHLFAEPDPSAFTSRHWARFARQLSIDLRALPYAWFAARREGPPPEAGLARILGRPRVEKGLARVDVCLPGEVRGLRLLERDARALVRAWRKGARETDARRIRVEGERIVAIDGGGDDGLASA